LDASLKAGSTGKFQSPTFLAAADPSRAELDPTKSALVGAPVRPLVTTNGRAAAAEKVRKQPVVPSAEADSQSKKRVGRQLEGWLYRKVPESDFFSGS
jgi:hypothetical protein